MIGLLEPPHEVLELLFSEHQGTLRYSNAGAGVVGEADPSHGIVGLWVTVELPDNPPGLEACLQVLVPSTEAVKTVSLGHVVIPVGSSNDGRIRCMLQTFFLRKRLPVRPRGPCSGVRSPVRQERSLRLLSIPLQIRRA